MLTENSEGIRIRVPVEGGSGRDVFLPDFALVDTQRLIRELRDFVRPPQAASQSFGEISAQWEASYLPRAATSARADLKSTLKRLRRAFSAALPDVLTKATAEELLGQLRTKRGPASARTRNKHRWVGMQVLAAGIESGAWVGPNVFEQVKPWKQRKKKKAALTPDEALRLVFTVRREVRALFAAAIYTGARRGELVWWGRADVDLERGLMSFRASQGNEWTKNGTQREDLPIHRELLPFLRSHLESHSSPWVFPDRKGARRADDWDAAAITRRAMRKAAIIGPDGVTKDVDFHGLRRVAATLYKKAGTDNLVRKLLLGHAVKDITDDVYTTLDEGFMRSEMEKMSLGEVKCARLGSNQLPSDSKSEGQFKPPVESPFPLAQAILGNVARQFWPKVKKGPGCWLWAGAQKSKDNPYGSMKVGGRHLSAHRIAYELAGGLLLPGEVVRHTCHRPTCVNPAHLVRGTHADNRAACVRDGRHAKGEDNGRAKLSAADVKSIWRRVAREGTTTLAREYGVDPKIIRNIRDGKSWRHLQRVR